MRDGEDWLSRTIQTVDVVMKQHGFEQDAQRRDELSGKESSAKKRWNVKVLLQALASKSSK